MKQFNKISIVCLLAYIIDVQSMDDSLKDVIAQYEIALEDLVDVYQSIKPPKPIQFDQTDVIGSTYQKILQPYITKISGYSRMVMSGFARKFSYYHDLQVLYRSFQQYQKEVEQLSKKFPKKIQQDAMQYFYNQLTTSLVQNCSKIVQNISFALSTSSQDLQAAKLAYELAWTAQTSTMKVPGFSSVADFRSKMTSSMINLYQAAVKQQTENLQQEKDKQKTYQSIIGYYKVMAEVYENSGNAQQAQIEKDNAVKIQGVVQSYNKAVSLFNQAEKKAEQARTLIIIDFNRTSQTKTQVTDSLKELKDAQSLYMQAEKLYAQGENLAQVALCKAKQSELQADQAMRGIQLLWILFLDNDYRSGVKSSVQAFSQIESLYKGDINQKIDVQSMIQALTDLEELCSTVPNQYNDSLALVPLIQRATQLYQEAGIHHVHAHHPDRLAEKTTLQDIETSLKSFVSLVKGMIQFTKDPTNISLTQTVSSMLIHAKIIDSLFENNNYLKDFFINFSELSSKKTFVSFLFEYVYRISMDKISVYMDTQQNDQIVQVLSYIAVLQTYKQELTDQQWSTVQQYRDRLLKSTNIQQLAKEAYQKAKQNQGWKDGSKSLTYQSSANTLWQKSLHLYEMAILLSQDDPSYSMPELQKTYLQVLYDYLSAYLNNAPRDPRYSLYVINNLYQLYIGATASNNKEMITFVQNVFVGIFENKPGAFSQVKKWDDQIKDPQTTNKQQDKLQQSTSDIIKIFQMTLEQQSITLSQIASMFQLSKKPEALLSSSDRDGIITLRATFEGKDFSVKVTTPDAFKKEELMKKISSDLNEAEAAMQKQDFASAATLYQQLEQSYMALLKVTKVSAEEQEYKQKYFLVKTRTTACSLASSAQFTGSEALESITNIPKQYYARAYHVAINMQDLASSVPSTLQAITQDQSLSAAQLKDALEVFKAFTVSQMLSQQGVQFADCYSNYLLNQKAAITSTNKEVADSIEEKVNVYMALFDTVGVSATVSSNTITLSFKDMPIPAIDPLYPTSLYAAVYFVGASMLFKPGKKLVTIAGTSYVPGQDETSYQVVLQELAYAYLSQAKQNLDTAQTALQEVIKLVQDTVKDSKKVDMKKFNSLYTQVKQQFIRAQALLFATDASAYYYFEQAKESGKAEEVKKIFINSYKEQIDGMKKLLVGNPFANYYLTVLSDINQAYVSCSSELNPNTDMEQIDENNAAIISLFVKAANDCMSYKYIGTMFTHVEQYHYIGAAKNYLAARKQYLAMQDTSNADKLNEQALKAYFLACGQNIKLYYSVKKYGLVYTPTEILGSGSDQKATSKQISYAQLNQANEQFENGMNVNPGETGAYTDVKRLLLDAAMFYQYLAGQYQKQVAPSTTQTTSAKSKQKGMNPKLKSYLQEKDILLGQQTSVNFADDNIRQQVFNMSFDTYVHFADDAGALASWCNTLNMAVAYQYIQDYLGGVKVSGPGQAQVFQQKWQTFFQAVQKEGTAFQNPAAAYVG